MSSETKTSKNMLSLTCRILLIEYFVYFPDAAQEANEALLEENKRLRQQADDLRVCSTCTTDTT